MLPFTPTLRETLRAVIDAFRPEDCPVTTRQATDRALRFLSDLENDGSNSIAEIKRLLEGLGFFIDFAGKLDRGAVRERLSDMEHGRGFWALVRRDSRDLARFAQRLALFCIYGTLVERDGKLRPVAGEKLGYAVHEDTERGGAIEIPKEPILPAELIVPEDGRAPDREFDVIVIGSGSAGSVITRRLVEEYHLDVALVEAGDYVPEGRDSVAPGGVRRPLPHDEIENLRRYYKDAGLQLTKGHQMFVFQGQCLGGTSVVNNAVCFRLPRHKREEWAEEHGVWWAQSEKLDHAYDRLADELGIRPAKTEFLNATGRLLSEGVGRRELHRVVANVSGTDDEKRDCTGCGYCNLTCAYLRKNTVLQGMLPQAARSALAGHGNLTVLLGRRAHSVYGGGSTFRPTGVRVIGKRGERRHELLRGKVVVVAAGAIASSGILARSHAVAGLGLPIGRRFSFNFGSPVHADMEQRVSSWNGLQIGHYYDDDFEGDGFVIESWFNPPATQILAFPGWLDEMQANIDRYDYYACAAPLIGSSARSSVLDRKHATREDAWVRLGDDDLARLKQGLIKTCQLFFGMKEKPRRVLLGALDDWAVDASNYRERIERISDFREIQIGTGHPQGGNALSRGGRTGVVDSHFRVHGTRRLFVADASVFPSSIGVNPHWTVMAIADLAAEEVAKSL